jgi:hypothetical protein
MIESKTELLEKERSENHNDKLVDALDLMVSDLEYIRLKIHELSESMTVSKYKNTSNCNQDSTWSSLDQDRMCGQFTQQEIDNSTRWK